MKLHKTPQKERSTYSYQFFDADGKPEPRITIHPGADDVTEVDIKQQHAFDDSEVYFNIKALRPEEDEQQKAEKAVWRERYITDFTAKYGYKPHEQDIADAANEEFPKYWIVSLDEMQEGNENHDGYMDRSSILASLCTSDDPEESPLVERLQYYVKNSHPGIVDESIWECVQQEIQRQKEYCEKHHIARYHQHSEKHPLSARIVCATCGCTYIQMVSRRAGTEGETYWRCSSFKGNHGTEVEGRTFTPEPMATWTKNPDRYKYCPRKPPVERSMLCTDIQVPVEAPEAAFVAAWNTLVREKAKIRVGGDSALSKYRASELMGLLESAGEIHAFNYALSVRVLDCIEVGPDGKLTVAFLAGIRI